MQHWAISVSPVTRPQGEEVNTSLSTSPPKAIERNYVIPQPSFLQTRQTWSPQPLLMEAAVLLSFFGHIWEPSHSLIDCAGQHCTHRTQTTPVLNIAESSPFLTIWLLWVCPGRSLPSWLPWHTSGSQLACCQSALPYPHCRTDLQPLFSWFILVSRVSSSYVQNPVLNFMPLMIAQCSVYLNHSARPFFPSRGKNHIPDCYYQHNC